MNIGEGTVRDLATYDSNTDTTTIANHRVYDAYGNVTSETNAAVDCLFGFTGRQFDKDTGLQNNLNRWYDPKVGRWTSEDPIRFNGGDANLIGYVCNSPLDSVDPSGLKLIIDPKATPKQRRDIQHAIGVIGRGANGKQLLNRLRDSDNTHTIHWSDGDNQTTIGPHKAGVGTGSDVDFNPDKRIGGRDEDDSVRRATYIGLAHELGHAEDADRGRWSSDRGAGEPGTTPPSEINSLKRENEVRSEHGAPIRPYYY